MAEEERSAKWGMVIDLDLCTGCNACVTACSMENNIKWVGEEDAGYGRGMHWIRMERFWTGEYPEVKPTRRPMLCQHCGNAPCEPVCPVFASVHSEEEQLNLQVYNRCIGTRYCGNNCPYFVRVFNFFDYEIPEPMNYYLNPDVSVRRRGVMEKCTFCVHRIQRGQQRANIENREVADGEIITACAQACPTDAIVFGNMRDPESAVSKAARSQRGFRELDYLGTEPRIIYLKGEGTYGS
jgi:molybdopterin-containing oxidoreductase family iron-sulfur binding subunit